MSNIPQIDILDVLRQQYYNIITKNTEAADNSKKTGETKDIFQINLQKCIETLNSKVFVILDGIMPYKNVEKYQLTKSEYYEYIQRNCNLYINYFTINKIITYTEVKASLIMEFSWFEVILEKAARMELLDYFVSLSDDKYSHLIEQIKAVICPEANRYLEDTIHDILEGKKLINFGVEVRTDLVYKFALKGDENQIGKSFDLEDVIHELNEYLLDIEGDDDTYADVMKYLFDDKKHYAMYKDGNNYFYSAPDFNFSNVAIDYNASEFDVTMISNSECQLAIYLGKDEKIDNINKAIKKLRKEIQAQESSRERAISDLAEQISFEKAVAYSEKVLLPSGVIPKYLHYIEFNPLGINNIVAMYACRRLGLLEDKNIARSQDNNSHYKMERLWQGVFKDITKPAEMKNSNIGEENALEINFRQNLYSTKQLVFAMIDAIVKLEPTLSPYVASHKAQEIEFTGYDSGDDIININDKNCINITLPFMVNFAKSELFQLILSVLVNAYTDVRKTSKVPIVELDHMYGLDDASDKDSDIPVTFVSRLGAAVRFTPESYKVHGYTLLEDEIDHWQTKLNNIVYLRGKDSVTANDKVDSVLEENNKSEHSMLEINNYINQLLIMRDQFECGSCSKFKMIKEYDKLLESEADIALKELNEVKETISKCISEQRNLKFMETVIY